MHASRRFLKIRAAALAAAVIFILVMAQAVRCGFPPAAASNGYAMKLECAGGYTGADEEWLVRPDGRILNAAGQTARVSPEDVHEWRTMFADLKRSGKATDPDAPGIPLSMCMDCSTCRVMVYGKDRAESFVLTSLSVRGATAAGMSMGKLREQLRHLEWK